MSFVPDHSGLLSDPAEELRLDVGNRPDPGCREGSIGDSRKQTQPQWVDGCLGRCRRARDQAMKHVTHDVIIPPVT
jgi:hypothetical protein